MGYDGLLREVTIDIVLGLLAIYLGHILGVLVAGAFGFLGAILYIIFALASLVGGVYLIVRGFGKLVEDIVRAEVARSA